MIWIAVIGLLWLSCFGFYAVSAKQILKPENLVTLFSEFSYAH